MDQIGLYKYASLRHLKYKPRKHTNFINVELDRTPIHLYQPITGKNAPPKKDLSPEKRAKHEAETKAKRKARKKKIRKLEKKQRRARAKMDTQATREAYRDRKKKLKRLYEKEFGRKKDKGKKTKVSSDDFGFEDKNEEELKEFDKDEEKALRNRKVKVSNDDFGFEDKNEEELKEFDRDERKALLKRQGKRKWTEEEESEIKVIYKALRAKQRMKVFNKDDTTTKENLESKQETFAKAVKYYTKEVYNKRKRSKKGKLRRNTSPPASEEAIREEAAADKEVIEEQKDKIVEDAVEEVKEEAKEEVKEEKKAKPAKDGPKGKLGLLLEICADWGFTEEAVLSSGIIKEINQDIVPDLITTVPGFDKLTRAQQQIIAFYNRVDINVVPMEEKLRTLINKSTKTLTKSRKAFFDTVYKQIAAHGLYSSNYTEEVGSKVLTLISEVPGFADLESAKRYQIASWALHEKKDLQEMQDDYAIKYRRLGLTTKALPSLKLTFSSAKAKKSRSKSKAKEAEVITT